MQQDPKVNRGCFDPREQPLPRKRRHTKKKGAIDEGGGNGGGDIVKKASGQPSRVQ